MFQGGVSATTVAIEYALAWGIDAIRQRVTSVAEQLRASLATIPAVTVRDRGRTKCGIVSFTVDGSNPMDVQKALRGRGVNVGALGRRRTPLEEREVGLVVRASVHYLTIEEEVERLVASVRQLARRA
jgi:selenocysteine lyase/cysteine desulfurase